MNLVDVFEKIAETQPDHVAVFGPENDARWSYRDLLRRITETGRELERIGVQRGDCIGLHYSSGLEYIILTYAIWRCGACSVPIATELAKEEKQDICRGICLSAVITRPETALLFANFQNGDEIQCAETAVYLPLKTTREHPPGFADVNAAFLRFTSGTTGDSKGVVLSHETIFERISAANDALLLGPDDRVIWLLSMSYHFAVSIVAYLSFGSSIVLCKNHFGPTIVQNTIKHGGTLIYGSPVHYALMANDSSSEMLETVRLAISTTTSLKHTISDAFMTRFGIPLSEAYGIIEVGLPCINTDNGLEHQGSVGRVSPAYEISLKDIGLGDDLKAISLKGKGFFDAYYNPWQPLETIAPDGWFATGDLGRLDEDGYLYVGGRSKEVINNAGMKLFPQEVEKVLESHPWIKEACVFAHNHDYFGEIPYAQVVPADDAPFPVSEAELKRYCTQHLVAFKVPDRIIQVDMLARTASGKIIRDESRVTR